jgi:hypothetical protein
MVCPTGLFFFPTSSSTQVGIGEFNSKEVSFPSGIASEKFISGYLDHSSSPNLLINIYSTARSIWHTNSAIDLNFAITNLPTGQLAEAIITGYDTIQTIDIPTNSTEGAITTLSATATDAGNDPLTYRWYINSATTPIEGHSIDYTW